MFSNPAITVVLVADNYRDRAQRMLRSVLEQDIADQIVIFVYDRAHRAGKDFAELNHPNVVYEAVDRRLTLGQLQTRATLSATTDIIAFIEEHVTVPPGWARETLRRHAEGYAGMTGSFVAGNPARYFARILFSITYGTYILPQKSGATRQMPGDNSSFIRSKLLKYDDEMEMFFNTDTLLMRRLLADGEKLYRAAELELKHWNEHIFFHGWRALFYWNQMYICNVVILERWSLLHRLARFLATPLVPFVRLLKSCRQTIRNNVDLKQFVADSPVAFLYHCASALGMATGLLFGFQDSELQFTNCETGKPRAN
jgi:glycosyltransferase involved in cell wall biosynthesis